MKSLSKTILNLKFSPIRELVPFARKAKEEGIKVYHLNIGQPDIKTPDIVWKKLKTMDKQVLEYSPSDGFLWFKDSVARYYNKVGININADQLIITTGGSEAIYFALLTILNPGDEIIIPEPFYANYNTFTRIAGGKIVPITSYLKDNFKLPKLSEFEKKITNKTKAILICNPNNPTGYVYSKEEMENLAKLVKKYDLFLIADEVYREFVYSKKDEHFSALNLPEIKDNVIVVDSVSKRYSACGARIGFFVTRNEEILNNVMKLAQSRLSPPTIEQIVINEALSVNSDYINNSITEYKKRRDYLYERLKNIPGIDVRLPKGAFYIIAGLPVKSSSKFAKWLLTDFRYKKSTLMLAPASGFYATKGLGQNEVRIAYVLNLRDLEKAIDILEQALKNYTD